MNDFTLALNLPHHIHLENNDALDSPKRWRAANNKFVVDDLWTEPPHCRNSAMFFPFGIRAYMGEPSDALTRSEPITVYNNDMVLFFVGRIYNLDELWQSYKHYRRPHPTKTYSSKLLLLFKLYKTYGIDYMLQLLDGQFTMVLVDQRVNQNESRIYVVSESMGALPLYASTVCDAGADPVYFYSTRKLADQDSEPSRLMPMGSYRVYTLHHRVRAKWELAHTGKYHVLGRSKGCIGITPFSVPKPTEYATVRMMLLYMLQCVIEKRLNSMVWDPEHDAAGAHADATIVRDVVCIKLDGATDDPEHELLVRLLTDMCEQRGLKLSHAQLDETRGTVSLDDGSLLTDKDPAITRFFTSSLIMMTERVLISGLNTSSYQNCTHPSIQYDYDFQRTLQEISETSIVPVIYEPLKRDGIHVDFPLLDASWLDAYLSLSANYRFDHGMDTLFAEETDV